jgi:hypothetical protein
MSCPASEIDSFFFGCVSALASTFLESLSSVLILLRLLHADYRHDLLFYRCAH